MSRSRSLLWHGARLIACAALVGLLASQGARAELVPPPGWFAGDVHVHDPVGCGGVAGPQSVYAAMPPDLNVASALLWCGLNGQLLAETAAYFLGQQDDPVSTPGRIVHYDLEVAFCGDADRIGHGLYLNLMDISFPASSYQGPIQEWALAQPGAVVGVAHANLFAAGYDEFPQPDRCCIPFEAPLSVALGRADFLGYQPDDEGRWRFLWYSLLDLGFRPGIAVASDALCALAVGFVRTYARIEGELTYQKFVAALAAGRVVVVEGSGGFVEFTVNGVASGDQLDLPQPGTSVELRAQLIAPEGVAISGTLEIVRNQEVVASLPYDQLEGELLLTHSDVVQQSSWYAARTEKSHSGAVYAIVAGRPIRASLASATYHADYMDHLSALVAGGAFQRAHAIDEQPLLADIAAARGVFEAIAMETVPEPARAVQQALGIAVLVALRRRKRRPTGR